MRRLFTMMADQIQSTAASLRHWWSTLSPDPSTWVPFTWVLAALLLLGLLILIMRPRRPAAGRRPELLISHGELRFVGAPERVASSLYAPAEGAFALSMTVSNLSAVPVQLLELALRTNGSTAPTTAEVPAVLPPHGAVEVSAELREAGGDEGTLELFVYVPDMPPKTFRVRARLLWEPWNARFRVLPLDQKVEPARRLAERGLRRREAARRSPGRPTAAERRAYEARFPAAELEREVRFEPRPESARPRASWPAEPRPSTAFPSASESHRPSGAAGPDAASGRVPAGDPDGGRRVEPDASPRGSGDDGVTIWPPRRSPIGRGSRGERPRGEQRPSERPSSERPSSEQAVADRREAERLASLRRESLRRERERERQEQARREAERAETERRDAERREAERRDAERREAAAARQRAVEARHAQERRGRQRPPAPEGPAPERPVQDRPAQGRRAPTRPLPERPAAEGPQDRPADRPAPPDAPAPSEGRSARREEGDAAGNGPAAPRPGRSGGSTTSEKDDEPRPRLEFPDEF